MRIPIILILLKFADPQSRESRAFFSHRGERQTRVTDDEAQGTMGRRKAEVRFFFPAFLCAQIFVEREKFGTRQGTFKGLHQVTPTKKTKTIKIEPRKIKLRHKTKISYTLSYRRKAIFYRSLLQFDKVIQYEI